MSEDWQAQKFRSSVVAKINEVLTATGQDPTKNANVMENHIYKKSRTKDEYLGLVAKLFMHLKEMSTTEWPARKQQMGGSGEMMQDPLNALQNLASQGNRPPQMMPMPPGGPNQLGLGGPVAASNLLQTLNQQRPGGGQMQLRMGVGPGGASVGVGGPGGQQMVPVPPQQIVGGMPMMGGSSGGGPGNQQVSQMVGNAQQISAMAAAAQMSQMAGGGGPGGPQMQMQGGGPGQGPGPGPINVNGINVQQIPQLQQMNQNQLNMNMNHPQLNQMMNARGPNTTPQNMPGMPTNMQQNQSTMPILSVNVVGGVGSGPGVGSGQQGPQQVGGGSAGPVGQSGNLNQVLSMPPAPGMQQKPNLPNMAQSSGGGPQMFAVSRGVGGQQQFLRQSPSPSTVPSPAGMSAVQQQQQLQQQQQQQPQQQQGGIPPNPQQQQQQSSSQSPAQLTPNSQMIASPAMVAASSPQMPNLMQSNQRNLRQSPSAPLNTPGQVASNSPFNPHEDQLYREKYKQLTKYIEPLKRMVAKIGNDGTNTEKITKMSKLLEILSNPAQRVPLETLLKCEKALEKMEIVSYSGQQFGKSSNPLMEVINTTLQSPIANHTLYRTFRPSLELLFGTDISAPISPKIPRKEENVTHFGYEIPHVLQGEIARLDQKFKVTLDGTAPPTKKSIRLICCLDDRRLPSVPPVSVYIPTDYPWSSPDCALAEQEYLATPFLKVVHNAFIARIAKLPKCYSLSHLLDTWEMAVRQACAPNATKSINDLSSIFCF